LIIKKNLDMTNHTEYKIDVLHGFYHFSGHDRDSLIMECPDLKNLQSRHKGQNRIDRAVKSLGGDVVSRILSYSLYLFGFPYDFISRKTGLSEAGLKTLAQQTNKDGAVRFHDRRRIAKDSYLKEKGKDAIAAATVKYNEKAGNYAEFEIKGNFSIRLGKDDILGKKLLALLFTDAGILMQKDAAKIMGCRRLAVRQNLLKFQASGTKGLLDRRRGQTKNHKFDSKVIFEILKKFVSGVFDMETPTKSNTSKHLNEKFSRGFSERATALHLKKMGLTDHKKELIAEIVRRTNERIDLLEYLKFEDGRLGARSDPNNEMLKKVRDGLVSCLPNENMAGNFFQIEKKVEDFQAELQVSLLESILTKIKGEFSQCPSCRSGDVTVYESGITNVRKKNFAIKTGLGGFLFLETGLLPKGRCNSCEKEFDIAKDILKLSENNKFTPLAQKKICSANRACSYLNAVRNLNELTNIDLNRNQVRMISMHVGEFIQNEFDELYGDMQKKSPKIAQKHPLADELRIDERYLDESKYLIVLAVDGGRMQMFDWIPPKKKTRWVETKVFRISVYDKTNLCDVSFDKDDTGEKKVCKSAKMISGMTTYGATNRNWEETGPLIISHLFMRGVKPEDVRICISDGSRHIMEKIFLPLFPDATHILDYYHKNRALHKCLKTNGEMKKLQRLKNHLWEGETDEIITVLKKIQLKAGKPEEGKKRENDDPKVILDNLINHLGDNKDRLKYKKFRDCKYPIGSGSVESAVKLFGKRIKGTEKQWSEEGGEPILHLYAFLLSEDERWKKLWEVLHPWM